jgi:hypothetical protein
MSRLLGAELVPGSGILSNRTHPKRSSCTEEHMDDRHFRHRPARQVRSALVQGVNVIIILTAGLVLHCTCAHVPLASRTREAADKRYLRPRGKLTETIWKYRDIDMGFNPGPWHFFIGCEGELGLPFERFLRLYATRDDGGPAIRVSGPRDFHKLKGVSLSDCAQATRFATFFTTRSTSSLSRSTPFYSIAEVVDCSEECCLDTLAALVSAGDIEATCVEKGGEGFQVTRIVVGRKHRGPYSLVKLTETIGRNLSYARNTVTIGALPRSCVRMPTSE